MPWFRAEGAIMANTWFRYHADVLHHPRVQKLPDALFKLWVNLQCLLTLENVGASGKLPPIDEISYSLRVSISDLEKALDNLVDKGLLRSRIVTVGDEIGDKTVTECDGKCDDLPQQKQLEVFSQKRDYFLKNWAEKQYKSDSSTERTKRYRERHKNVTANGPDQIRSDTDTDQIKEAGSFHSENGSKGSGYDIRSHLSAEGLLAARAYAPGWDMDKLAASYNRAIAEGRFQEPRRPNSAYPAWVQTITKGARPK